MPFVRIQYGDGMEVNLVSGNPNGATEHPLGLIKDPHLLYVIWRPYAILVLIDRFLGRL